MLDNIINFLDMVLFSIGDVFIYTIGAMTVGSWFFPLKAPADTSNRFNRVRLWWYVVSAPHRFIKSFWWLKGDETDNLNDNTWDEEK